MTALLVTPAHSAPSIDWFSIDSGGGVAAGGTIELRGVIGQPDPGPVLTSGTVELTGGWLAGPTPAGGPPGCNVADIALPYGVLDLSDINVFVSGFLTQDPVSDIDGNALFDLTDINLFASQFIGGCP